MLKNKRLSMCNPAIDTVAKHAFLLSTIGNNEQLIPWLHNNYIQLGVQKGKYYLDFMSSSDARYILWMDSTSIHRKLVIKWHPNIIKFIEDCIDEDYYIHAIVDEFYIPGTYSYQVKYAPHNILVHGYDKEKETLNIAGFFSHSKYSFNQTVTYSAYEKAFNSVKVEDDSLKNIILFKAIPDPSYNGRIIFNIKFVYNAIHNYIMSTQNREFNTANFAPLDYVFGLEIYNTLCTYFELLIDGKVTYDIRQLHTLYIHKVRMVERIKFMLENNYVKDVDTLLLEYKEIENESLMIRNLQLKCYLTQKNESLKTIISILKKMQSKERVILEQLLEKINKHEFSLSNLV